MQVNIGDKQTIEDKRKTLAEYHVYGWSTKDFIYYALRTLYKEYDDEEIDEIYKDTFGEHSG
jgi:hypothetical protein